MEQRRHLFGLLLILTALMTVFGCSALKPGLRGKEAVPPVSPEREFRAVWVATVANIDWPSKPGLSSDDQKAEAVAILDKSSAINLNAVILQVRAQCDAFYKSDIEPWSYFLTGEQGKAPDPYYDPLAFWVEEAHKRGLELHVWFNPYRAHHPNSGEVTPASVVRKHPDIALELKGGYWWLDPSLKATQDYSISVILDVVHRYDIDGVHLDDYFYPYPEYNDMKDFPDNDSWEAYRGSGGKLSRGDWRRDNVNRFIKRLYREIKKEKPMVKFGLSPFGIWRPGSPATIRGFDQYDVLYADAKLWLNEGWVDYFTPQLYWPVNRIPQSYPVLLGWWTRENLKKRNLWPGLYTSRVADERGVDENINQIMVTRGFVPEGPGNVHFSMKAFLENYGGIADSLVTGPYKRPALVPVCPWLDKKAPKPPVVQITGSGNDSTIHFTPGDSEEIFHWAVYYKRGDMWDYALIPGTRRYYAFDDFPPVANADDSNPAIVEIAVSAIDRMGNESERTLVKTGQ